MPVRQNFLAMRQVPGQVRVERASSRSNGAEVVRAAGWGQQGGRAEPDVAVDRLGQVDAEERQGGVRDRVDEAADEMLWRGLAGAGSRRGTGRSAGRPVRRRPRPGDRTRGRRTRRRALAGIAPSEVWTIVVTAVAFQAVDRRRPSGSSRPPRWISAAIDRATAAKSTMPVSGECSAATPTVCGSISAISPPVRRRRPGNAVLDASALELVELDDLLVVQRDDQLAALLVRDPVLARSSRRASRDPRCRAGPSASRARSRCPRGRRRSCGRSGARRCRARAPARARGRPGVRCSNSRAVARPRMPAPTTTTSQGRSISGSRVRRRRRLPSQEVEVAAFVGLGDVVGEQHRVAAGGGTFSGHPDRTPRGELVFRDEQVEPAGRDVEHDLVAGLDERQRPADERLGRDVQHAGAVRRCRTCGRR